MNIIVYEFSAVIGMRQGHDLVAHLDRCLGFSTRFGAAQFCWDWKNRFVWMLRIDSQEIVIGGNGRDRAKDRGEFLLKLVTCQQNDSI
jgi:hypothetical protein